MEGWDVICTEITSCDSVWDETRKVCAVGFRVVSLVLAHVLEYNITVWGSEFSDFC